MLVLIYQILLLSGSDNTGKYTSKIFATASSLQKKDNIPQVSIHISLIKEVQTDQYWKTINIKKLESLRVALRDLIKYLDTKTQEPIYTHFEDDLDYDGNQQSIYKYQTRFLDSLGNLLQDENDYTTRLNNSENVYIACFVGCTYHCG